MHSYWVLVILMVLSTCHGATFFAGFYACTSSATDGIQLPLMYLAKNTCQQNGDTSFNIDCTGKIVTMYNSSLDCTGHAAQYPLDQCIPNLEPGVSGGYSCIQIDSGDFRRTRSQVDDTATSCSGAETAAEFLQFDKCFAPFLDGRSSKYEKVNSTAWQRTLYNGGGCDNGHINSTDTGLADGSCQAGTRYDFVTASQPEPGSSSGFSASLSTTLLGLTTMVLATMIMM